MTWLRRKRAADDVFGMCPEAVREGELAPVGPFNDPTGWW
jgi:hypothetical protein